MGYLTINHIHNNSTTKHKTKEHNSSNKGMVITLIKASSIVHLTLDSSTDKTEE